MNTIIGLDIGNKRIGVAFGYEELKQAFPKEAINIENAISTLMDIIRKENIKKCVIGLALNENNEETTISKDTREFAKILKGACHDIEILFVDEYLSSVEAKERLNIKSKDKKTRESGIVDSYSACIILERYFANEGIIIK